MADDDNMIILVILCIFIPPLAVWWKDRDCNQWVLIALILMLLFWLPGIIFAFWYCLMRK